MNSETKTKPNERRIVTAVLLTWTAALAALAFAACGAPDDFSARWDATEDAGPTPIAHQERMRELNTRTSPRT